MAYTAIDDPSAHFHINLHTGDGESSLAITNDANAGDFSPDWLWIKNRTSGGGAGHNMLLDTTRGNTKYIHADTYETEGTASNVVVSFDTDGFTVGNSGLTNEDGSSFVAFQWKANGGTRTTNTESGNDPGGGYQANTTAGFSIVDYTGTGGAGTMAHGLGAVPRVIMVKNRSSATDWAVYHASNTAAPETDYLVLNETTATADSDAWWNDTAPTSTVFSLGTHDRVNDDSETLMAYLWAEKQGYSKFGSYTGNGNEDGPFVYLGFKPRWILFKNTTAAEEWVLQDTTRSPINPVILNIRPDSNIAEASSSAIDFDFLSNGFKNRSDQAQVNSDGVVYIYMAFAENPFVTSGGVPCTAK